MILILLLLVSSSYCLPNGAPPKVCDSMEPFHGGGIQRQFTPSPYKVITFNRGGGIQVVIRSLLDLPFQGFMLQARTPSRELVGMFQPDPDNAHTLDCAGPGDTVTHNNKDSKSIIEVQWMPNGFTGMVIFNATVAQDYATFWVGIESVPVEISPHAVSDDPYSPTFPTRPRITTPPYFYPEQPQPPSTEFDPFYSGCAETKLCFGAPADCIASKNCKAAVAVLVNGNRYEFEMKATDGAAWVGVGLSEDEQMGDDSVIECVREGNGVDAYMSWTSARPNLGVTRLRNSKMGITMVKGGIVDGALQCKVIRDTRTVVNGKEFDLANNKYNLLVASGSSIQRNQVSYHDLAFQASGESKALADVTTVAAASKLLLRLHGAFMIAAWLGAASIGILLARYYRQTWVGSTLCGKDMWFAWHRMLMVLTWALTTTAFVLIFVELKAWSAARNPHAILGVVTTALCFLQPLGAYFRPHPGTSKRPVFNWVHWLGGNTAHILAIITIFFAVKLSKAELPEWMDWILVAYVIFHVVMHLILSISGCISEKSAEMRVTSFPMRDLGGSGRTSAYSDNNYDAPYSGWRKLLLAVYIIVIILLVVALIVITVLAPVEEFWENVRSGMKNA